MLKTARNVGLQLCALQTSGPASTQEAGGTYTNPVSKGFADTFAAPSIIKARDGFLYVPSFGHAERRLP